ncbi:MAG: UTP--glucose-1-phosphate uridylyltransferase [Myxococcota bacterium]
MILDDPRIDHGLLERYRFDRARFLKAVTEIESGRLTEESSKITGKIEPAAGVVDVRWDGAEAEAAKKLGEEALSRGEVAVVVLNGGMATRFGNVVKGVVEVYDQKSFIALKAEDTKKAAQRYGAPVPLVLMNSFATERASLDHVAAHGRFGLAERDLLSFAQSISLRLTHEAALFIGKDGLPSYYAPGHGDFFAGIRASGVLANLLGRGVRTILFSNVDNLGATVDPAVIGYHLRSGAEMSAEVTAKRKTASGEWDKGGAPAIVDGRQQLVEGFRLPGDLPPTYLPDFSTNNFLFSAKSLEKDVHLAWHLVKKKVDDRPALQLESIACEASAADDAQGQPVFRTGFLRVPRDGKRGRFFPIKERVDLETSREVLRERLSG